MVFNLKNAIEKKIILQYGYSITKLKKNLWPIFFLNKLEKVEIKKKIKN